MASRSAQTNKAPIQVHLAEGSLFACEECGRKEFRILSDQDAPLHLFCHCGKIYTPGDLPLLKEG